MWENIFLLPHSPLPLDLDMGHAPISSKIRCSDLQSTHAEEGRVLQHCLSSFTCVFWFLVFGCFFLYWQRLPLKSLPAYLDISATLPLPYVMGRGSLDRGTRWHFYQVTLNWGIHILRVPSEDISQNTMPGRVQGNPGHGRTYSFESLCGADVFPSIPPPISLLPPCQRVRVPAVNAACERQQFAWYHRTNCYNQGDWLGANALWSLSRQRNQMQHMFWTEGRQRWMCRRFLLPVK